MTFRSSAWLRLGFATGLVAAGLAMTAGCNRLPDTQAVAETSEPDYEEGKRLLKQGNEQAALAAFSRVIETRRDGAPESHLEVGLLYQLEIKDPIAAIYHFRRYLELKPNAPQADLVHQQIAAATRDFARTLPAQPMENMALRNDLFDVVSKLQTENARLKDEVAALRAGTALPPAPVSSAGRPGVAVSNPPIATAAGLAGNDAQSGRFVPMPADTVASPTRPANDPARTAAPTSTAGQRMHTVVKGDTLYALARKYYNNPSRAKDIYAANRDRMKSEADLQIGMQLVIPE